VGSAAAATREDARTAVEAVQAAFPGWSATPSAERRRLLERAGDLLMERQADLAAIVMEETGGTFGWGCSPCSSRPACSDPPAGAEPPAARNSGTPATQDRHGWRPACASAGS
jgi:hypothetical protein